MKQSSSLCLAFGAALISLLTTLGAATAPAQAQVIVERRDKTIEEVFEECAARIRLIVTNAQTSIDRARDTSIRKLERLDAKNVPVDVLELGSARLKKAFPSLSRAGVIRLNREIARSMFALRKHKDYEPEFQTRLDEEVDEALFDLQELVNNANAALDEAVARLSSN
jgi:hypothetical protein